MEDVGKYVVLKRESVTHTSLHSGGLSSFFPSSIITDAVVIRLQDVFAASALAAYGDAILTTMEVMGEIGMTIPSQLIEIADYFHTQALAARMLPKRKLPD